MEFTYVNPNDVLQDNCSHRIQPRGYRGQRPTKHTRYEETRKSSVRQKLIHDVERQHLIPSRDHLRRKRVAVRVPGENDDAAQAGQNAKQDQAWLWCHH
jgi:hypothetical protein